MPLEHRVIMLLLRVECLAGAMERALKSGDAATALRLLAESKATAEEARQLAEQGRNL